jgi:glycosyltransferase involved in cell wall biosynthesis
MHLGIDASRTTVARRTGTESYALHLIRALLRQAGPHRVTLYFRDAPTRGLFNLGEAHSNEVRSNEFRIIPFPRLWTHLRLSAELLQRPPHLLFVPAHVVPAVCPVPAVVTVHDLGYRYYPDAHPFAQRLYLDLSTRHSARAAAHVIADSEATKRDLIRFYHTPNDKITVVYPGRDETLRRVDAAPVRAKYRLPESYLLHIGTLQPRKNLVRLIEATRHQPSPIPLVLAGRPGWLSEEILKAARAAPHVRLLSYVPDADLAGLYSGAAAFVFPSLYEGFGFPALEALACGAPVICSNTSSLPEVVGEAALTVNPLDVAALAEAIRRVLGDAELRAALIAKGYEQVEKFSWEKAARETWAILERAAQR